jgi:hypothetical protein
MGQFWAVLVRREDHQECSDKKIVSRCRERAGRVYYDAVFEIKKEIPVKPSYNIHATTSSFWWQSTFLSVDSLSTSSSTFSGPKGRGYGTCNYSVDRRFD